MKRERSTRLRLRRLHFENNALGVFRIPTIGERSTFKRLASNEETIRHRDDRGDHEETMSSRLKT
jgi:hypothetical protein